MCVLTHTQPASIRAAMRLALPMSLVHTEEARPKSLPLAKRSASSSSVNFCTVRTGPKISVVISSSSCFRSATIVGS